MRQLDMADAMFVLTEQPSRNTQHIGMIFLFDPSSADVPVTYEAVLELFRQRVPLARTFREKLVRVPLDLDYPYWVNDDAFDLEFHVRKSAVPRPGTRQQFLELAGQLMSSPLDMSRPLWESWFVEGLDAVGDVPKGSFALILKMHHAAVDGVSGMEMVSALLEDEATALANMPAEEWVPETSPDQATLLQKAVGASWSSPMKLTDALLRGLPTLSQNRKKVKSGEVVKPPKTKAPRTRFNAKVTPHKVLDGRSFDFAEIRRIKNAIPQATVNDVVVGIVGGALRRYLTAHDELPDTSLVVTVPISLRTNDQQGTGGNQLTFAYVPAQTDIADPVKRVMAVGETMRSVKEYNKAIDARTLQQSTAAMPGMLMGVAMRGLLALPLGDKIVISNAVVTNVPGPMEPRTLLGARYVGGFGAGPSTDGIGLVHAILSLSGLLSIGFSACRELMPDPEFYGQCIEDSYNELLVAVEPKPKKRAPAKRKTKAAKARTAAKKAPAKPANAQTSKAKTAKAKSRAAKPKKA